MECEVESEVESLFVVYRLCDHAEDITSTRMFRRVSYIGEVLQCRLACDSHNHHDPLAFWVRQRSKSASFEAFEQRHSYRIKKSQAWN